MNRYQLEEDLGLLPLFPRVLWANFRPVKTEKIRFGPHSHQYVLWCEPPEDVARRSTGIVFAHGGGWRMGNPREFRFVGKFFADLGFPTLLTGYRLAPTFKFPAQLEDIYSGCQAGVQELKRRGVAPEKWILVGQSAGAHLMALLTYMDPARREATLGRPAGLLLVSGLLDFSLCATGDVDKLIANLTGDETLRAAADPICYVEGGETIPVLCIHGDRDPLVDPRNSLAFAEKVGASARVHMAEGWHHADLAEIFIRLNLPVSKIMVEWLDTVAPPVPG